VTEDQGVAVSVVIPTRARSHLLERALRSVMAQTFADWEAVVVIDGADPASEGLIGRLRDSRLRSVTNARRMGGAEARNVGVRAARGDWIALLDDDDEWMPDKLAKQLATLEVTDSGTIGFTAEIVRTGKADHRWPHRGPRGGEHVSDYLFSRSGLKPGGPMHTSTLVAPRDLFMRVPFDPSLRRFQDSDWVLRAVHAGATITYCPAVLTIRHEDDGTGSIHEDTGKDWRLAIDFVRSRRHLMTRNAVAWFVLVRGGGASSAAGDLRGAWQVLAASFQLGRPSPSAVATFLARWLIPPRWRQRLRSWQAR
jgi:glycosyltransferase involved in cell wall biosynthesis